MSEFPTDIYTEPSDLDGHTLANLGPLRRMAGLWRGEKGIDVKPKAQGPKTQVYVEHYELQPIDPQTNGPQVLYGLRYHTYIHKPGLTKMYHDQVGYWLWEPSTGLVLQSLTLPRGQTALASGHAKPDDMNLGVSATRGQTNYGICSTDFLEYAFRTDSYRLEITFNPDGSWSYVSDTMLKVRGQTELFRHRDLNTLVKVAEPKPNPLMQIQAGRAV
jgi:hypothetical protein